MPSGGNGDQPLSARSDDATERHTCQASFIHCNSNGIPLSGARRAMVEDQRLQGRRSVAEWMNAAELIGRG